MCLNKVDPTMSTAIFVVATDEGRALGSRFFWRATVFGCCWGRLYLLQPKLEHQIKNKSQLEHVFDICNRAYRSRLWGPWAVTFGTWLEQPWYSIKLKFLYRIAKLGKQKQIISAACTQRRLHFVLSLKFWELTNMTVMHTGCTLMISSVYNQFIRLEPYFFTSDKMSWSVCVLISTVHTPLKERCIYSSRIILKLYTYSLYNRNQDRRKCSVPENDRVEKKLWQWGIDPSISKK